MDLDNRTLEKFSRQILVDDIGYDGQVRLLSHRVLISGPLPWRLLAARYLAAAGIATAQSGDQEQTGDVRIRLLSGPLPDLVIATGPDVGRATVNIGLALTGFLLTLASMEGSHDSA